MKTFALSECRKYRERQSKGWKLTQRRAPAYMYMNLDIRETGVFSWALIPIAINTRRINSERTSATIKGSRNDIDWIREKNAPFIK